VRNLKRAKSAATGALVKTRNIFYLKINKTSKCFDARKEDF
jgi:hypothetical protein